jgi:hypothetical protein
MNSIFDLLSGNFFFQPPKAPPENGTSATVDQTAQSWFQPPKAPPENGTSATVDQTAQSWFQRLKQSTCRPSNVSQPTLKASNQQKQTSKKSRIGHIYRRLKEIIKAASTPAPRKKPYVNMIVITDQGFRHLSPEERQTAIQKVRLITNFSTEELGKLAKEFRASRDIRRHLRDPSTQLVMFFSDIQAATSQGVKLENRIIEWKSSLPSKEKPPGSRPPSLPSLSESSSED